MARRVLQPAQVQRLIAPPRPHYQRVLSTCALTPDADRICFLFPGMGSQYIGMARDLPAEYPYIKTFLKECDDFFGFSLSDLMFHGEAALLRQPLFCGLATFVHSLSLWKILQREYQVSSANTAWTAMGHSMGEYSALSVVNAFHRFESALDMTRFYAQSMQSLATSEQAMLAILGRSGHAIDLALLGEVVQRHGVDIANINAPNQVIISGLRDGIDVAMNEFLRDESGTSKGVRGVFLQNVGGAYHSRFMQPAADEISGAMRGGVVDLAQPEQAIYLNVLGGAYDMHAGHDICEIMGQQVHGQVHWHECIHRYVTSVGEGFEGTTHFVEVGPGSVLRKLVQGICRYHGYAGKFNFVGIDSAESISGIESVL